MVCIVCVFVFYSVVSFYFVFLMFILIRVAILNVFYVLCVAAMFSMCLRYVDAIDRGFCLFYVFVCMIVLFRFYSN
jgi:hypothetical protein